MLVTQWSIDSNLRRTAEKGLISLLNQYQLEQLALKYFGVYENEQLIGYQCPYSGEVITNFNDIVLEHIIPVSSNGGTVLFNCIPTSKEVNGADQKGAKHLIEWWTTSNYWNQEAPDRLEKLLNYMLEAYDLVFREYTIEEVENSYLEIEPDETILEEEDNLALDERTESNLLKQAKNNGIHSYLGFILDCITTLEKNNINTSSIKEKLANLEEQNIFKDIEKYQLYQNVIKQLIISRLGDNNSSYLSYTLNFDIKKLIDSINLDNQEDIYNELDLRLKNIEQLLSSNNLSIVEYFKSLRDVTEIDIIYKNINEISKEDINIFLENIKIGIDTKIDIFIDMLSDKKYTSYENGKPDKDNIFSFRNKIPFKGYESIAGLSTNHFWKCNFNKIKYRLDILEKKQIIQKKKKKNQRVRRAIKEYEFQCRNNRGLILRIDCFIEMLSDKKYTSYEKGKPDKYNIFSIQNKIPFKGYENIDGLNTDRIWKYHLERLKERLDILEKKSNNTKEEQEKYKKARKAIKEYEFFTDLEKRIDCFIEMLSDKKYTSYENGIPNKDNIFSFRNKIPFKGYESIDGFDTSTFWYNNLEKIIERLDVLEKNPNNLEEDKGKYQRARRAINEYEFLVDLEKRMDCFIEMLSDKKYTSYENGKPNKDNIFSPLNKILFKGYESINGLNTNYFWSRHFDKIKERLDILEKNSNNTETEQEKYQRARRAIAEYEFLVDLEKRIDCFIKMLSDKQYTSYENGKPNKYNIFSSQNKIPFKDYENIDGLYISAFWHNNLKKIIERLDILEKNPNNTEEDKEKYQRARRAIAEYEFLVDLEKRIDCFIEMLSDKKYTSYENGKTNSQNIFSSSNKILFKDYESINGLNTSQFWNVNLEKIKERLDILEKNPDNTETEQEKYKKARKAIKEYEFQSQDTGLILRIDCFIEMLSDKQYTSYENGNPNKDNIFSFRNKIPFKGYESIVGLNTAGFWGNNSDKIKERIDYLIINSKTAEEKEKYQKIKLIIEEYDFTTNFEKRIDCFIEMLSDKKYTSYENGKPNKYNIFSSLNKQIPFKGYDKIDGLNTGQFWSRNSTKMIIPLLFFNKQYDVNNKVYIDSEKDYSTKEYDVARSSILEYLKVTNINEYINKLEQKQKKTNDVINLINLRNSTREVLEYLTKEEEKLIKENNQLRDEYLKKQNGTEIRRAV